MTSHPMNIWHIGADSAIHCVNGVNTVVWSVARSQVRAGHSVTVILPSEPDEATVRVSRKEQLKVFVARRGNWPLALGSLACLLKAERPEIVHMHSVFIPQQNALAAALAAAGVPYVITPHGGLSAAVLGRGKLKKKVYSALFEKRRFTRAATVTVSNPLEVADVRQFVPAYKGPVPVIFNPVKVAEPHAVNRSRQPSPDRATVVFLGRLDVLHKGIDRLVEIARCHAEADYRLYGSQDPRTQPWLDSIKRNKPPNVVFHPPVFDTKKAEVLTSADLYIQPSRWEGFPLSVAEAMALGVPCAISESLGMTDLCRANGLTHILATEPDRAADGIRQLLADRPALLALGNRGQAFARENFRPSAVADMYLDIYQQAIRTRNDGVESEPQPDFAPSIAGQNVA